MGHRRRARRFRRRPQHSAPVPFAARTSAAPEPSGLPSYPSRSHAVPRQCRVGPAAREPLQSQQPGLGVFDLAPDCMSLLHSFRESGRPLIYGIERGPVFRAPHATAKVVPVLDPREATLFRLSQTSAGGLMSIDGCRNESCGSVLHHATMLQSAIAPRCAGRDLLVEAVRFGRDEYGWKRPPPRSGSGRERPDPAARTHPAPT